MPTAAQQEERLETASLLSSASPFGAAVNYADEDLKVSAPSGATVFGIHFTKNQLILWGGLFIFIVGLILGLTITPPSEDPAPWDRISSVIGWWYFTAWVVSFWPQLYLNYTRQCVVGQSFDPVFMNVLGYACYTIYACGFYFFTEVQDEYEQRFHNKNNVDPNDLGFAIYSLFLCTYNCWQILTYDRGEQKIHRTTIVGISLTVAIFIVWLVILLCGVRTTIIFNTLDILYGLSVAKLAVSFIKYLPQIHLNYKRKLTVGWNIWNVLLDFIGGFLSVTQQLIDCGTTGRWNGIVGNLLKFSLGCLSMFYDIVFIVQHYCLYNENNAVVNSMKSVSLKEEGEGEKAGAIVVNEEEVNAA